MGDSREEIFEKEYQVSTAFKEEALSLRLSIAEHMNNCTKFLTNFVNVDVDIEEEDKALILLNSLPDEEYETSSSH